VTPTYPSGTLREKVHIRHIRHRVASHEAHRWAWDRSPEGTSCDGIFPSATRCVLCLVSIVAGKLVNLDQRRTHNTQRLKLWCVFLSQTPTHSLRSPPINSHDPHFATQPGSCSHAPHAPQRPRCTLPERPPDVCRLLPRRAAVAAAKGDSGVRHAPSEASASVRHRCLMTRAHSRCRSCHALGHRRARAEQMENLPQSAKNTRCQPM
jgi:hypothetical protein